MPDARLHFSQSGLAKSPCRGFATRILAGAGLPTPVFFSRRVARTRQAGAISNGRGHLFVCVA